MACKRTFKDVPSFYGYPSDDEFHISDDEEWSKPRLPASRSRQSTIFPPKKQRVDSTIIKTKQQERNCDELQESCFGHSRTIIHIDIDCFYAQVEMIRDPKLREVPLGIQQKHIVVTCNYVARKHGVKKLVFVSDAKKACPELVLVNGEDLTVYREFSGKVHSLLTRKFTAAVERLGMDENFLDVSEIVKSRILSASSEQIKLCGFLYNRNEDMDSVKNIVPCFCGCHERLIIGSMIAAEVRQAIFQETGLTCCAGVGHSKLLAKLVGGYKKPNEQSTIFPEGVDMLLAGLQARDIPGIGHSTGKKLRAMNISSVLDLRSCELQILESEFGNPLALTMMKLCYGIDDSEVISSGDFKSISDEDSFQKCSTLHDTRTRLKCLIEGLLPRIVDDVGIPQTVRLTIRRHAVHSHKRESRQCGLPHTFAVCDQQQKAATLLSVCMELFTKVVDIHQPFHLTLLGVSLTNFSKPGKVVSKTITNFFRRQFSETQGQPVDGNEIPTKGMQGGGRHISKEVEKHCSGYSVDNVLTLWKNQQKPFQDGVIRFHKLKHSESDRSANGHEEQKEVKLSTQKNNPELSGLDGEGSNRVVCPAGVDPTVFAELPFEVQQELQGCWKHLKKKTLQDKRSNSKKNTEIRSYFSKS